MLHVLTHSFPTRRSSDLLTPPADISILNIIPFIVKEIGEEKGPQVDLQLDAGGAPLWARITARSCAALKLKPGLQAYALVTSVAIDRQSPGRLDAAARFLPEANCRGDRVAMLRYNGAASAGPPGIVNLVAPTGRSSRK